MAEEPHDARGHRTTRAVILAGFACLLVAVVGMIALALALLRT